VNDVSKFPANSSPVSSIVGLPIAQIHFRLAHFQPEIEFLHSLDQPRPPVSPGGRRAEFDQTAVSEKMHANGSARHGCSGLMLRAPFLDDGQSILDVFFRVGIGVGVKNLSLRRNHIGNAIGEGRAQGTKSLPR